MNLLQGDLNCYCARHIFRMPQFLRLNSFNPRDYVIHVAIPFVFFPFMVHFIHCLLLLFHGSFVPLLLPIWSGQLLMPLLIYMFSEVIKQEGLIIIVAFPELLWPHFFCFPALSVFYQPFFAGSLSQKRFPLFVRDLFLQWRRCSSKSSLFVSAVALTNIVRSAQRNKTNNFKSRRTYAFSLILPSF